MSAALLTTSDDFRNQSFTIKDSELFVDMDSRDLDAYVWHAPGDVQVYFVFIEQEVHIITLDDGELPFKQVRTRNEKITVMPVGDEEVTQYAAIADGLRTSHTEMKNIVWQ